MNILIFGPQGSGKTTQAQLLAKKLGLPLISAGDISREIAKENSERGGLVKSHLDQGELTPDEIIGPEINQRLREAEKQGGFITDGWPRTLVQAQFTQQSVDAVFLVNVSKEVSLQRLLARGREDDTPEAIRERLKIYWEETMPVIEHYKNLGVPVFEINGEQGIEKVQEEILVKLRQI